jgi:hypothetical protein
MKAKIGIHTAIDIIGEWLYEYSKLTDEDIVGGNTMAAMLELTFGGEFVKAGTATQQMINGQACIVYEVEELAIEEKNVLGEVFE